MDDQEYRVWNACTFTNTVTDGTAGEIELGLVYPVFSAVCGEARSCE